MKNCEADGGKRGNGNGYTYDAHNRNSENENYAYQTMLVVRSLCAHIRTRSKRTLFGAAVVSLLLLVQQKQNEHNDT